MFLLYFWEREYSHGRVEISHIWGSGAEGETFALLDSILCALCSNVFREADVSATKHNAENTSRSAIEALLGETLICFARSPRAY